MKAKPDIGERLDDPRLVSGQEPEDADRVGSAMRRLALHMEKSLAGRRAEIVDLVGVDVWRYLLGLQPVEERRGMLSQIGLPWASKRLGVRLLEDFTARLRRGVRAGAGVAFLAAHDLTGPVRESVAACARLGRPFPETGPVDAPTRACAVALCPDRSRFYLPVALTWMRLHDPDSFQLLLPDPEQRGALTDFFDEVNLDPDRYAELLQRDSDESHADHRQAPDGASAHHPSENTPSPLTPSGINADDVGNGSPVQDTEQRVKADAGLAHGSLASPSAPAPPADPRDVAKAAHQALNAAVATCRRTLSQLEEGQPPAAEAAADLSRARQAILDAAAALGEQLAEPVPATIGAIDAAAHRLIRSTEDARALRRLLHLRVPDNAAAALDEVVALTTSLLDSWPPSSEQEHADAATLVALAELVRASTTEPVDDADIDTRYEQLRASAPATFLPLLNAAVRGRVHLPAPEEANGATDDTPASGASGHRGTPPQPATSDSETSLPQPSLPQEARPAPIDPAPARTRAEQPPTVARPHPQPVSGHPVSTMPTPETQPAPTPAPVVPTQRAGDGGRAEQPVPADPQVPASMASSDPRRPQAEDVGEPTLPVVGAVVDKAAAWLTSGQFALVFHLMRSQQPALAAAARLAALADAAAGPSGPHELELNVSLAPAEAELLVDGDAARLLTTGAALLATAVTGSTALGNLLVELADRMDEPAAQLARPLGEAARTGLLAGRGLAALTGRSADEAPVVEAAERVRARLTTLTHRSSRLPRASHVLDRLRTTSRQSGSPNTLAEALAAAAGDQRQHAEEIGGLLVKLSKPAVLEKLIDEDDRDHRAAVSKPIEGAVRQEMLATLKDDVAAVARWIGACAQLDRLAGADYIDSHLSNLSRTVRTRHQSLLKMLASRFDDTDLLVAACARAAHSHVLRLVNLLSGVEGIGGAEPDVNITLDLPLLAIPAASWDIVTGLRLPPELGGDALVDALLDVPDSGMQPLTAARIHASRDDFRSAEFLLSHLPEPLRTTERERLVTDRGARVDELRERLHAVQRHLSRARVADNDTAAAGTHAALDAFTEEQLSHQLGRALSSLDDIDVDLRPVAATIDEVQTAIDKLLEANKQRLTDELAALLAADPSLARSDIERARRRIEKGQLDLAADDITHLSAGEALFDSVDEHDLADFFPSGVTAAIGGIDDDVLNAIRDGRTHPLLPSSPLPEMVRDDVHAGLQGWRSLRGAFGTGWQRQYVPDKLLPALRLVGLDARHGAVDHLDGKPFAYARGRRFLDLTGANITGKALVPAFGSAAQGRYRLLLVWNNPTVEQLDEWRESDGSHLPMIVCYLGTLGADDRVELARRWSDPTRRSALVLDDAVLAWIATRRGNFDMLMRLTLPFTSTQPFAREKRPDVPREMFYGRSRERRELTNPNGPSVVYGGRGLGKSALLRTIMADADASPNDDLVVVWFEVDHITGIEEDPGLLWGELAERLEAKGVTAGPRAGRSNPRERVAKAVRSWTSQPGKRLLILLDEAEGFFNGDAPRFADVRRLYQMSAESDFSCKVVFSGLHSVQHYYQASNIPFSPTGHLQIGPLAAQPAYRLLARPLAALGYQLDDDDAQRILLHCNYQPYLIQLVAHKLLAQQFDVRAAAKTPPKPPPWTVSRTDVDAALFNPQTRRDVQAALGLTLDIDVRTRVIASVLALHAYDNPPGTRMADLDLYDECRTAWPAGFAATTLVAFRELLNELAGLGILAETGYDGAGRAIRNETVLRALGSRDDAARHLREAAVVGLTVQESRGQTRPPITNGRSSPMTTAQLGQLYRKGNSARIIVGTEATGIADVSAALAEIAPAMVSVQRPSTAAAFKSALETGATDAQRMLVISDLSSRTNVDTCRKALTLALGDPTTGAGVPKDRAASRAVALVAGVGNLDWLVEVAARPDADGLVIPLERYTEHALPLRWRGEPDLDAFASGQLARDTFDVTDGWPFLVELLAVEGRSRRAGRSPGAALEQILGLQADERWCREFLGTAGAILPSWPDMARLVEVLVQYDAPCSPRDVSVLAADKVRHLEQTVRMAHWFGIVALTATDELQLSNLIASCWRTAKVVAG